MLQCLLVIKCVCNSSTGIWQNAVCLTCNGSLHVFVTFDKAVEQQRDGCIYMDTLLMEGIHHGVEPTSPISYQSGNAGEVDRDKAEFVQSAMIQQQVDHSSSISLACLHRITSVIELVHYAVHYHTDRGSVITVVLRNVGWTKSATTSSAHQSMYGETVRHGHRGAMHWSSPTTR